MKHGEVSKAADGFQVVFNRTINHSIDKVWEALTDPASLAQWFTDIDMDFRVGGKITFRFRDKAKSESYGEIVSIEPPHKFVYTWEGELATWELDEEGTNKCNLRLTYQRLSQDYAANVPAGFHTLLNRLEASLNGIRTYYAFGSDEADPEQKKLQMEYGVFIHQLYPDLETFKPVKIEKLINAPREKIWHALTRKEEMKSWYFEVSDFKPQVGFKFTFSGKGSKGEDYVHHCEVTQVIPLQLLQYTWEYANHPGYSVVTFTLHDDNGNTLVTVEHRGLETFPQTISDFNKKSFIGGWTELITKLLPNYAE